MPKFLIDSDVLIWFLRGQKQAVELMDILKKSGTAVCSPISIVEIQAGVKKGEEIKTNQLLDSLAVYPVNKEIAYLAGDLIREYKNKGWRASVPDALIGATCLVHKSVLVTLNKRHYPFRGIKIYPF